MKIYKTIAVEPATHTKIRRVVSLNGMKITSLLDKLVDAELKKIENEQETV
jgi:hypothetical protein